MVLLLRHRETLRWTSLKEKQGGAMYWNLKACSSPRIGGEETKLSSKNAGN
jgi:hypothetical protein